MLSGNGLVFSFDIPCDGELDEMHQVLAAVTNSAGLVAVAVTGGTPRAVTLIYSTAWPHLSVTVKYNVKESEQREQSCP